jgi:hypothetical protein
MRSFPSRVITAGIMTIALNACAVSKSSQPPPVPCLVPAELGPQVLYPENHARGVSVDVGEMLYAQSPVLPQQGTLYLQGAHVITVTPQGIAPKPYPSPLGTPLPLAGPIAYATFGKLAPATTYIVKFRQPASTVPPQPCSSVESFTQK